jgi:hypothetical protein
LQALEFQLAELVVAQALALASQLVQLHQEAGRLLALGR